MRPGRFRPCRPGWAQVAAVTGAAAVAGLLGVAAPAAQSAEAASGVLATCFWEGPISTEQASTRGFDGRNFNYPEESATYWLARFRMPEGARLILRGNYAHARYQSLNAYSDGAPTDALADVQTQPDPGSTNPFLAGNLRNLPDRAYHVTVVDQAPPADPAARAANTLYARPQGDVPIELLYRVYDADRGRDLAGGTGLPQPELVLGDGRVLRGEQLCDAVNDANRDITVQTTPAAQWYAVTHPLGCDPYTGPAQNPPRWNRFFNRGHAILGMSAVCTAAGTAAWEQLPAEETGGLYSNRDTRYVYSWVNRRHGPVLVLRGRMPTFPQNHDGQPRMTSGQVRFWSLCTGEGGVTTRTPDCVADRSIPLDDNRDYTIVVSRAADRPANARAECGIAWLDWGDRGDAAGNPDFGMLIMRNMLASPDFEQAIQRIRRPGTEQQVMGDHFPRSTYATTSEVEALGCRA